MVSKLKNYRALTMIRDAALFSIGRTHAAEDPRDLHIDLVTETIYQLRDATQQIICSFQDELEEFNVTFKDPAYSLIDLLYDIDKISEFDARYDEEEQKKIIAEVTQQLDSIQEIDVDDSNILTSALTIAILAIETERKFYEIFGAKVFGEESSTKSSAQQSAALSDEELKELQKETTDERIDRMTHEISNIDSEFDIIRAVLKTIDLAMLIKTQTNDEKVIQAADAIITLRTNECVNPTNAKMFDIDIINEQPKEKSMDSVTPFEMFDKTNALINLVPDGTYKRALLAAFAINIAFAALNNSADWVKLRENGMEIVINNTTAAVAALELTMLENISKPDANMLNERTDAIRYAYTNAKQLDELLQDYRKLAAYCKIDLELVDKAQVTIDSAAAACMDAMKKWNLNNDPKGSTSARRKSTETGIKLRRPSSRKTIW